MSDDFEDATEEIAPELPADGWIVTLDPMPDPDQPHRDGLIIVLDAKNKPLRRYRVRIDNGTRRVRLARMH